MRKFISIILILILSFTVSSVFVGCNGGDGGDNQPVYATEFSYNETHHWRNQTNGTGTIEYGVHREDSGWCEVCHMYFECPNLRYRKITIDGVQGYEVYEYDELYESETILHVEVPKYYKDEDDDVPLPVISIANGVFNCSDSSKRISTCIKSIKLNEGLLSIGSYAFAGSDIKELIIPDSVFGNNGSSWNNYGLTCIAYTCSSLEKVVIGNGVRVLDYYNFSECINLKEVKFGSSIVEIGERNFYNVRGVKYAVLPASLISIPETQIYVPSADYMFRLVGIFGSSTVLYFEITEEQYNALIIPAKERDNKGYIIHEKDKPKTTWGYAEGWDSGATKYFKGEWHYNDKGVPVPN